MKKETAEINPRIDELKHSIQLLNNKLKRRKKSGKDATDVLAEWERFKEELSELVHGHKKEPKATPKKTPPKTPKKGRGQLSNDELQKISSVLGRDKNGKIIIHNPSTHAELKDWVWYNAAPLRVKLPWKNCVDIKFTNHKILVDGGRVKYTCTYQKGEAKQEISLQYCLNGKNSFRNMKSHIKDILTSLYSGDVHLSDMFIKH